MKRTSLPTFLIAWLVFLALPLGFVVIWQRMLGLLPLFLVLAITAAVLGMVWMVRITRDLLNPVTLVLGLGLIRWSVPALILALTNHDTSPYRIFAVLGLSTESLLIGHALVLTGMLAFVGGWLLLRDLDPPRVAFRFPDSTGAIAAVAMVLGLLSLLLFVGTNAGSVIEAADEGSFRGTEIEAGTGWAFKLSFALLSGSVVASAFLLTRRRATLVSAAPAVFATLVFLMLGGRSRAVAPLAAVGMLVWYRRQQRLGWPMPRLKALIGRGAAVLLVLMWFAYVGSLYRGGGGLDAVASKAASPEAMATYLKNAALVDIGHLHGAASATMLRPGVLGGTAFAGQLLWPVSELVDVGGPLGGRTIVRTLAAERGFGVHPSLMGDAYLNFGAFGGAAAVVIVPAALGVLVKLAYGRFRAGSLSPAVYVLVPVYTLRVFLAAVHKWSEGLLAIVLTAGVLFVARQASAARRERGSITARPPAQPPVLSPQLSGKPR